MVKDKVIIITGAAGGIGSAAARLLGREGAVLILADIREEHLCSLEKDLKEAGIRAYSFRHDVTDPASWQSLMARALGLFGRVDILINNAGVVQPGDAEKVSPAKIQQQVSVNLMGNIHGCRAVLPVMKKQRSGKIINVASLGGIVPMPGEAVYSATKAAIRQYSFSLAAEVRESGIGVTAVCPDSVETAQLRYELLHDEAVLSFVGEALKPEQVAKAILKATAKNKPEILVPPGTGGLARTLMSFPGIFFFVWPMLRRIGSKNIGERRKRETGQRDPSPKNSQAVPEKPGIPQRDLNPSKIIRSAAVGELVVATGIILFWIAFYAFGLVDIPDPRLREIYLAFESAFPFADLCLALVLLRGGIGLLRRASYGTLFSVLGGAALVFLGLLDISFNSRHGIYRLGYEEALANGTINILCLGFGLFLVKTVWKNRIEGRDFARAS